MRCSGVKRKTGDWRHRHTHRTLHSKATPLRRNTRSTGNRETEKGQREKKRRHRHMVACASKNTWAWRKKKGRSRGHFFFSLFFFSLSHGSLDTVIGCRVAFLGATWRRRRLLRFPARGRGGRGGGTRCRHRRGGRRLFLGRGESRTGRRVRL